MSDHARVPENITEETGIEEDGCEHESTDKKDPVHPRAPLGNTEMGGNCSFLSISAQRQVAKR
jgi:hypothetical protein